MRRRLLLLPPVVVATLLSGNVAMGAWSQSASPVPEGRVRVGGEGFPEPPMGDFSRAVEVLAPADVCWEMRLVDFDPVEYCGRGGVGLPGPFGGSGPQKGVTITKTRGREPVTVVVYNSRAELKRDTLVNVSDSVNAL